MCLVKHTCVLNEPLPDMIYDVDHELHVSESTTYTNVSLNKNNIKQRLLVDEYAERAVRT